MNMDGDGEPVAIDDDFDTKLGSIKNCDGEGGREGEVVIKIVSATYGASARRRLLTGEISTIGPANAPYTRDVAPFIRALLSAHQQQENYHQGDEMEEEATGDLATSANGETGDNDMIRFGGAQPGVSTFLALMDGKTMNAIFGDPCPGTSKQLKIHYVVFDASGDARSRAAASELHRSTFSEHERVVLRRRLNFFQDESKLKDAAATAARKSAGISSVSESKALLVSPDTCDDASDDESTLRAARRMGRSQSIFEFTQDIASTKRFKTSAFGDVPKKWRLRSATSEIVLPIVMQFLEVKERVQSQMVCMSWRFIVQYYGVAKTVDINDPSFPSSRSFLRGIMSHSYSSLQSLFLNDFRELTRDDLHPAIQHLRKLRSLDISRCEQLDDSTLKLISRHLNRFLEVFYMKGLQKVTDEGLISICHHCTKLKVLEISNVPITDESGIAIGENLKKLSALYMRDNYLLTNRSIDIITEKCSRLSQLTLWGCTRLQHLSFDLLNRSGVSGCGNLVLLNLWGCHSLLDEAAKALAPMKSLRSLIASECHRLTDRFVVGLAENVPQLVHLQLRYCKRVTGDGVNVITNSMPNLYTLDLSFCTRITAGSLFNLLKLRKTSLSELRLQNCHQLSVGVDPDQIEPRLNGGSSGRSLVNALSSGGNCLCILDVRSCGGHPDVKEPYLDGDPFVQGMGLLDFQQVLPGFFSRPARWNPNVQQRLVDQVMSLTRSNNAAHTVTA